MHDIHKSLIRTQTNLCLSMHNPSVAIIHQKIKCIMHIVHQTSTNTQTKLQLYTSMVTFQWRLLTKGQMNDAEYPAKCHTQPTKSAAFFKYAHHSTDHHTL